MSISDLNEKVITCHNCGKKIPLINGIYIPPECPVCKSDLTGTEDEVKTNDSDVFRTKSYRNAQVV